MRPDTGRSGISRLGRWVAAAVVAWAALASGQLVAASPWDPVVLYATGFEVEEGYRPAEENLLLWNQGMGWEGEGSGGNGVVTNFFEGFGQQAFIGYTPPLLKDEYLNLWWPLDELAPPPGWSVVKFSAWMQIVDSTNNKADDFRWSVYNADVHRLFSLDFDNDWGEVFFTLDDGFFYETGYTFSNEEAYYVEIYMDCEANRWSALLNGTVVVDAQPMTTTGAGLQIADVDAVWYLHEPRNAGDNYMLFDDYWIEAVRLPELEMVGLQANGDFAMVLHGEPGFTYAIDVAGDDLQWFELARSTLTTSSWRFQDETADEYPSGIYRARRVWESGVAGSGCGLQALRRGGVEQERATESGPGVFVGNKASLEIGRGAGRVVHPFTKERPPTQQVDREPIGFVFVGESAPQVVARMLQADGLEDQSGEPVGPKGVVPVGRVVGVPLKARAQHATVLLKGGLEGAGTDLAALQPGRGHRGRTAQDAIEVQIRRPNHLERACRAPAFRERCALEEHGAWVTTGHVEGGRIRTRVHP